MDVTAIESTEVYRVVNGRNSYWVERTWVQKEEPKYIIRDIYSNKEIQTGELKSSSIRANMIEAIEDSRGVIKSNDGLGSVILVSKCPGCGRVKEQDIVVQPSMTNYCFHCDGRNQNDIIEIRLKHKL